MIKALNNCRFLVFILILMFMAFIQCPPQAMEQKDSLPHSSNLPGTDLEEDGDDDDEESGLYKKFPTEQREFAQNGIKIYFSYKYPNWQLRKELANEIYTTVNKDLDNPFSGFKSPTELHITLLDGYLVPLTCPSQTQCQIVQTKKTLLRDIVQNLTTITQVNTQEKPKQLEQLLAAFFDLFEPTKQTSLFTIYPESQWDTGNLEELRKEISKEIYQSKIIIRQGLKIKTEEKKIRRPKTEVQKIYDQIKLIKSAFYIRIPRISTTQVQHTLLFESPQLTSSTEITDRCYAAVNHLLMPAKKQLPPITSLIGSIREILYKWINIQFGETSPEIDKKLNIDWNFQVSVLPDNEKKAITYCNEFLVNAEDNKIPQQYAQFVESFQTQFDQIPLVFDQVIKLGSEHPRLKTFGLSLTPESNNRIFNAYQKLLYGLFPSLEKGNPINFFGQVGPFDLTKRTCLQENSTKCFMFVASNQYYNLQHHAMYHMTIFSTKLREDDNDDRTFNHFSSRLSNIKNSNFLQNWIMGATESIQFFQLGRFKFKAIETRIKGDILFEADVPLSEIPIDNEIYSNVWDSLNRTLSQNLYEKRDSSPSPYAKLLSGKFDIETFNFTVNFNKEEMKRLWFGSSKIIAMINKDKPEDLKALFQKLLPEDVRDTVDITHVFATQLDTTDQIPFISIRITVTVKAKTEDLPQVLPDLILSTDQLFLKGWQAFFAKGGKTKTVEISPRRGNYHKIEEMLDPKENATTINELYAFEKMLMQIDQDTEKSIHIFSIVSPENVVLWRHINTIKNLLQNFFQSGFAVDVQKGGDKNIVTVTITKHG